MHNFTLPSNIKQIGSIGDGLRIYVEDYVCTFLYQYAESGGFNERLAYLVGRHMVIDGQPILFIGGAIHGRYAEKHEGSLRFTADSADFAQDMLEEHFPGMEIVGWMQSQPSYGTYLNQNYGAYHLRQFKHPHQVLFVMDPLERTNAFYMANENALTPTDRMIEVSGYFIYYEKNTNMHDYMLATKAVDYTAKAPNFVETKKMAYVTDDKSHHEALIYEASSDHEPPYEDLIEDGYDDEYSEPAEPRFEGRNITSRFSMAGDVKPEEVIRRRQAAKVRRKGSIIEHKRTTNLLASLCAVLFVVSFVMGVGLIRNQDRIDRMEGEMRQLTTAYRNLFTQIMTSDTAPAFAETPPLNVAQNETEITAADVTHGTLPDSMYSQNAQHGTAPNIAYETPAATASESPSYTPSETASAAMPDIPHPSGHATFPAAQNSSNITASAYNTPQPAHQEPPQSTTATPTMQPTPTPPPQSPQAEHSTLIPPPPETYTIQPGDSLIAISIRFFGDAGMVNEILTLNGMENADHIVAGRTIALPRR